MVRLLLTLATETSQQCLPSTSTIQSPPSQLSSMCACTSPPKIAHDRPRTDLYAHSNLMVDTFIANADPEEYAISPSLLWHALTLFHNQVKGNSPKSTSLITTERLRTVSHHRSRPSETQALRTRITRNNDYPVIPHIQGWLLTTR